MTVNSTLGHISRDIVWVYTLLEHYTVILSCWAGGFTRINTVCLVYIKKIQIKKHLQMSLFPLFFFLFCKKTNYTSPDWQQLGVWKALSLCKDKDKAKQTKWNTQIYAHLFFFLGDSVFPRLSQNERQVKWNGVWALSQSDKNLPKNFVSFLLCESLGSHPWMMSWGDVCAWLADSFSLLLLAFIPLF